MRPLPTYLCDACGSPSTPCAGPRCSNMANRGTQAVTTPRYCGEHRHDIPGFDKTGARLATLDEAEAWLKFDKRNLSRGTKIAVGGVAALGVVMPLAFAAAPVIGGVVGVQTGLTGAAATSHGLALLGGGSLATGGLGMAGGTMVVGAVGSSLGGALGASVVSAYARDDPSFGISRLRSGPGRPVVLASGFLSEADDGWGSWGRLVDQLYPDSTVYRLTWGAKELRHLRGFVAGAAGKRAIHRSIVPMAKRAAKKTTGIPGLGPVLIAGDLLKNPWHVAKTRADMSGAALADLLTRCDESGFVLMGHSLGARVMVRAAQAMGTQATEPKIHTIHTLGAAVSTTNDWRTLHNAVSDTVWNYRSTNDPVLKYLYLVAQGGRTAVGRNGFGSAFANVRDRNVSRRVTSHSGYFDSVTLAKSA